ncbi:hypothetical protein RTBOTA2_001593 [Rhodotorula toruloides]|nr:hypothetical protein RTBOTA2_001593 [Rhodotorula toruloides]
MRVVSSGCTSRWIEISECPLRVYRGERVPRPKLKLSTDEDEHEHDAGQDLCAVRGTSSTAPVKVPHRTSFARTMNPIPSSTSSQAHSRQPGTRLESIAHTVALELGLDATTTPATLLAPSRAFAFALLPSTPPSADGRTLLNPGSPTKTPAFHCPLSATPATPRSLTAPRPPSHPEPSRPSARSQPDRKFVESPNPSSPPSAHDRLTQASIQADPSHAYRKS